MFQPYQGRVELHNAHQVQLIVRAEIEGDGLQQVSDVDSDLDKDIQDIRYGHVRDRHQAAVAIMHDKVAVKLLGGEVINAARAVCHITKDQALDRKGSFDRFLRAELCDYVRDKC